MLANLDSAESCEGRHCAVVFSESACNMQRLERRAIHLFADAPRVLTGMPDCRLVEIASPSAHDVRDYEPNSAPQ